jgi:hypothetical protein
MPSCHFVHLILLSSGPKVPKSGPFKNEGIHELAKRNHAHLLNRLMTPFQIAEQVKRPQDHAKIDQFLDDPLRI